MTAIAMNEFLQQLHDLVPSFDIASIPRDATGVYASPVHIIAELLNVTPSYIQKIINGICVNVDTNCTKMKVIVNGIEQRNRIMVGNAESILRVLAFCNRPDMAAIVARLPVVVPVHQASFVALVPQVPVAPAPQTPFVAEAPQVPVEPAPAHVQQIKKPLVLNGMVIEVDPVTSMVNATQMCQAGGKLFGDYYRQKSTEEFLQTLSLAMGIHIAELTNCKNGSHQGTMVHFQVALHVAYWLSSEVQVQFSKWIGELLLTGRVELGKEKTFEELDAIWKSRVAEEQAKIQSDYLREKLSKELLAIDEDRALKRAREEEDKNERIVKRQRDDYEYVKRQREDEASEEERAVKRQRDELAFQEEMKLKALQLITQKQKDELEYNKLVAPFVKDIEIQTNDAHIKSLCKDIGMACLAKIQNQVTGGSLSSPVTKFCNDITTIGCKLGFDRLFVEKNRGNLGKAVVEEYRRRNNKADPPKTDKYVNGGWYPVFTYDIEHEGWIGEIISKFLNKKQATPIEPKKSQTRNGRANLRTIGNSSTQ